MLRPALVLFVALTLITGIVYPLAVTGFAQTAFPHQANGSLIDAAGKPASGENARGSSLIGQDFSAGDPKESAKFFWGRLSATGPVPYTAFNGAAATGSSGSNLASSNPGLVDNARARIAALAAADAAVGYTRQAGTAIPIDLVTASGSGLDPHVSPAAIEYQLPRVAHARSVAEQDLRTLVAKYTTNRAGGVLGEPVVNVLELNLAFERRSMGKE